MLNLPALSSQAKTQRSEAGRGHPHAYVCSTFPPPHRKQRGLKQEGGIQLRMCAPPSRPADLPVVVGGPHQAESIQTCMRALSPQHVDLPAPAVRLQGRLTLVLGAPGSGKSALLKAFAGEHGVGHGYGRGCGR
eukprot:115950-Chlamydomonas_euryale.AAC.3